jgi:hypothetical protein
MREMMERLGIDPASGVIAHSSLTYLTALHCCQGCPSPQACRDWLDMCNTHECNKRVPLAVAGLVYVDNPEYV